MLKITQYNDEVIKSNYDFIVLALFEKNFQTDVCLTINKVLNGALLAAAKEEHFTAKEKDSVVINTLGRLKAKRVALLGIGNKQEYNEQTSELLGQRVVKIAQRVSANTILLVLPPNLQATKHLTVISRSAMLANYRFNRYRQKKLPQSVPTLLAIQTNDNLTKSRFKSLQSYATVIASAVTLARDLVNEPPCVLYPEAFALQAAKQARFHGLIFKKLSARELEKHNMRLLLAVGAGSAHKPCLVHLVYKAKKSTRNKKPLVLVGKGITFDAGGLCLKPPTSMDGMKSDMAGAAAVLAAMTAIAKLKPAQDVHAIIALAENMPAGNAMRPGDIIFSAAQKSVEIINTDAEGRLILADAFHFALKQSPAAIIDVATLTSACVIALGNTTAGLFCNDDKLAQQIENSAKQEGESLWRMPLLTSHKAQLKSEVADIRNVGAREGSAITAAMFLKEFIGKTPWAHIDIAGLAMSKANGETKSATGFAVATLVNLAVSQK
ncbi:MAG: leucyl aminopeptidase [Deltaproteobacteria bacterium]|nr:leucyl aminopeptidase [Deltaproteobacteria bacterium]